MIEVVALTIALAHDYAIETRIRRLLEAHQAAGDEPRTLVMSTETWHELIEELEGTRIDKGYFWAPGSGGRVLDSVSFFKGIPILIKDFVAYGEILVGV